MSMPEHVRIVAILQIVVGALGVLAGLFVLAIFGVGGAIAGVAAQKDPDALVAAPILGVIGIALFLFIVLASVPGIAAGIGLLKFRPWSRTLAIVVSALNLMSVPLGTALGVYSLWVLLNKDVEPLFQTAGPPVVPYPARPPA
jgi:hypothetical protein